jgi:hypothetical protein
MAYGHSGAGAVTWHRRITNEMERLLQMALGNHSFALPYWNFSGSAGKRSFVFCMTNICPLDPQT